MLEPILTYDKAKKTMVRAGFYNPKRRLFIKLCNSDHFMILERGYGIQEDVIQMLKREKCSKILIHTKTTTLISNLENWLKVKPKEYGHGLQRFLSVDKMKGAK